MSNSVKKAFEIIKFISSNQGKLSLSELGRKLNMNKTTMFRYLETLQLLNVLERRDSNWYLGIELFSLGHKVDAKSRIVDRIHPYLQEISKRLNETVNLVGMYDSSALYLDKVESNRALQMRSQLGDHLPLHCTSLGKAILSSLPEHEVENLLRIIKLKPYTSHTVTSVDELKKQIDFVKTNGYSLEKEELEPGLSCIAVPLHISSIDFYGGLSFSGSPDRFTEEKVQELSGELKALAGEILTMF
ncbi:MAG: IclR family transcriptional regulator [Spirochaetaceae bacterium]|nr:IclR family transcriptional regulator [Spirochaetaceae bacterium]